MENSNKLKKLAIFTVNKIVNVYEPELCPQCGSDEYYRYVEFIHTYKDYTHKSCDYADFRGKEYINTTYQCDECEYCHD